MGTLWPVALQWSPTPVGLSSLQWIAYKLESNAEGSLRLPNVGVEGVVVTRDVVDGAAQFLLGGFVLGVYEHWADGVARLMEQVYSMRLVGPWQLLR